MRSAFCAFAVLAMASVASSGLAADLSYTTSWFGNSFPGGVPTAGQPGTGSWVQSSVNDIWVAPDGRVFACSEWDEVGNENGIYKDGLAVGGFYGTHAL